jgi:hypothetical protein
MSEAQTVTVGLSEKLPSKVPSSSEKRRLTPVQAIRKKCLDCSCGSRSEVRECTLTHCPLYPYRMGRRPINTTDH